MRGTVSEGQGDRWGILGMRLVSGWVVLGEGFCWDGLACGMGVEVEVEVEFVRVRYLIDGSCTWSDGYGCEGVLLRPIGHWIGLDWIACMEVK